MFNRVFSVLVILFLGFACLFATGCGGVTLNEVSGKVTIKGEAPEVPLEILFLPKDDKGGKIGTACGGTGSDGTYQMSYPSGDKGVPEGEYNVSITVMPDSVPEGKKEPVIPSKYNTKTELSVTIKPGKNENINFDL